MNDQPSTAQMDERDPSKRATELRLIARVDGVEVGQLRLSAGKALIGRGASSDLVVDHPTVSGRHVEVSFVQGNLLVRDLETTNGTRYQGSRVREVMVPPGAVLKLGSAELRVEDARTPEPMRLGTFASVAESMRPVIEQLHKAAPTELTLLLRGETGTGKDVAARAVHAASPRASGPWVVVDCGSMPADLAPAELFGHLKGAFTGADRDRAGAFERARGGTLFLDEIGELPLPLQPLLLRALESREVRRVGEVGYRSIDVRVVAATNRDLDAEVGAGRFRQDLLHRLAVVEVTLPPLRGRLEDIPALVTSMLDEMGERAAGFTPSPDLLRALAELPWPGNIRELRNLINRAVALSEDGAVNSDALGLPAVEADGVPASDYRAARARALDLFERNFVLQLLKASGNNVSRAARDAGIDRVYLHRIIKKHGLGP